MLRRSAAFILLLLACAQAVAALPCEIAESTAPLNYAVAFPPNPVRLPQLLGDNAVLQRDQKVPIWGWGYHTRTVTVQLGDVVTSVPVGHFHNWATTIGPLKAGGPYELVVGDGHSTVTSRNVMVGDVWLCGGQSNMTHALAGIASGEREVASAGYPRLRLFQVPQNTALAPQNELPAGAHWAEASPQTAREFSAIGYLYGRALSEHLDIPVGVISANTPNTMAALWLSEAAASQFPDYENWKKVLRRTSTPSARARLDDEQRRVDWIETLQTEAEGSRGKGAYFREDVKAAAGWKTMRLPGAWELSALPKFDGVVWFRKEFTLPRGWPVESSSTLSLGHIYDHGTVWANGREIGRSSDWKTTFVRELGPGTWRVGANSITARVLDMEAYGGIHGATGSMLLRAGDTAISLAGAWRYRVATDLKTADRPWASTEFWPHPSVMYNGMIAPLVNHAICGVLWYQGEADDFQGYRYRELLTALIRDWRGRWKNPEMPVVLAQIASFLPREKEPGESRWAEVRESQAQVARKLDRVALVPMYDLGGTTEPHYIRKQEAAERLVAGARAVAYGDEDVVYSGPTYRRGSIRVKSSRVRVSFDTTTGGLVICGDEGIRGFAVAGKERKFYWADAELVTSDTVELRSARVPRPVAVRYNWSDQPWATLYNEEGLPALGFRTDDWPVSKLGHRW